MPAPAPEVGGRCSSGGEKITVVSNYKVAGESNKDPLKKWIGALVTLLLEVCGLGFSQMPGQNASVAAHQDFSVSLDPAVGLSLGIHGWNSVNSIQ